MSRAWVFKASLCVHMYQRGSNAALTIFFSFLAPTLNEANNLKEERADN